MARSAAIGALIGVLLVAGATAYYLTRVVPETTEKVPDRVVVIIESPGPDGAVGAQLLALVADGRLLDLDPDTTATVPGTSGSTLRDAYAFGGPAGVASALGTDTAAGGVGYVAVPESVWSAAVDKAGGVRVVLPSDMNVFDGRAMTLLPAGKQVLSGTAVGAALRGMPFIPSAQRTALRTSLEQGIASAIATGSVETTAMRSGLPGETLTQWLGTVLAPAAGR